MKTLLKTLLILLCLAASPSLFAQSNKVGYVNLDVLYEQWSQTAKYKQQMTANQQKHQKALENKQKTVDQKRQDTKASREEVVKLQEDLQLQYTQAEQTQMVQQENHRQLFETAVRKAIQEVAREKGYRSVQSIEQGLYYEEEDNLTEAVRKKMN